jgi:hypothetical protein
MVIVWRGRMEGHGFTGIEPWVSRNKYTGDRPRKVLTQAATSTVESAGLVERCGRGGVVVQF